MIIALDTETYIQNEKGEYEPTLDATKFSLGCILRPDRKQPTFFTNPEEMYQYIINLIEQEKKNKHKVYIYAHNHSYDYYAYAKNHLTETQNIKKMKDKPLFYIINETGYLLDTLSFFQSKLETMGKTIGLEKLEMPKTVKSIEELKPYLLRDTQIVMKSVQELSNQLSKLSHRPRKMLTAGQLAMTYFQSYLKSKPWKTITNKKGEQQKIPMSYMLFDKGKIIKQTNHYKLLRQAYRGGRNECYHTGEFQNITIIDINALYPYAMQQMRIPNLLTEQYTNTPTTKTLEKIGIIKCTIQAPNKEITYLPIRFRRAQVYPRKIQMTGTWTTYEIQKAIQEGYKIINLHEAITYEDQETNPFKDYFDELYNKREQYKQEGNKMMEHAIKLLMNNLYGKFAQITTLKDRQIIHRKETDNWLSKGYEVEMSYGTQNLMTKILNSKPAKYSHPMISINTTAYARTILYDYMNKIPYEDIIYADTDSIHFKNNHKEKYPINRKIGNFKIEHENVNALYIKEKFYRLYTTNGQITKASGITNRETLTEDQLKGETAMTTKRIYSFNQALRTGKFEKTGTFTEIDLFMMKTRKRLLELPPILIEYDKEELTTIELENE